MTVAQRFIHAEKLSFAEAAILLNEPVTEMLKWMEGTGSVHRNRERLSATTWALDELGLICETPYGASESTGRYNTVQAIWLDPIPCLLGITAACHGKETGGGIFVCRGRDNCPTEGWYYAYIGFNPDGTNVERLANINTILYA